MIYASKDLVGDFVSSFSVLRYFSQVEIVKRTLELLPVISVSIRKPRRKRGAKSDVEKKELVKPLAMAPASQASQVVADPAHSPGHRRLNLKNVSRARRQIRAHSSVTRRNHVFGNSMVSRHQ